MALDPTTLDEPDGNFDLEVKGEQIVFEYRIVDDFAKPDELKRASAFWGMVEEEDDDEGGEQEASITDVELLEEDFQPLIDFVHRQVCGVKIGLTVDWEDLEESRQRQILRRDTSGLVEAYVQIMGDDGIGEDEKKS